MSQAKRPACDVVAMGVVLSWILQACCPCVLAVDPSLDISQYAYTAWKVNQGFFKGVISSYSIAQTPDGYLWLGTEFGLFRFDGVRSVPWKPPAGEHLPRGSIRSLLAARDGRLWIGTTEGLASWKDGRVTHYPEITGQVRPLLEDSEGTIWAGGFVSSIGRLCAIRTDGIHCYGEDGRFGREVISLYEDKRGFLWAGAVTGLWRWKPGPPQLYPTLNRVRALIQGNDDALLAVMGDGIRQLVDGKDEPYSIPGGERVLHPLRLLRDRNGGLWIGTADRGIFHVHQGRTDAFSRSDGLSGDFVQGLFEDREGNVWVATSDGLDRFRDFAIPTISVKQGLSNAFIWSVLAARDGSVWLATRDGLNRWNDGQITIYRKRSSGLPDDSVQSILEDYRGRIWVATGRGIAYFENGRFTPVRDMPASKVHSIAEDSPGSLWFSDVDEGLFHLINERVVERIPWVRLGRKEGPRALIPDPVQGGLWLGFDSGLAYFNDGQLRASYTDADGMGKGRVTGLQLDRDNTLWAATEGGLSRLKNGGIATLTNRNGLPCDNVHWLIEDDDHSFWLDTACGLVRIPRAELDGWAKDPERRIQTTIFNSSDGVSSHSLPFYSPRVAKSSDGKIWFLTLDGVSVIDPRDLPFNQLPPPVHIEQITADHRTYDAVSDLRLPSLVRDLEIDYTALSLVAPENVMYRYKLEGYDLEWQDAGNRRQAFYTNLPWGNYRFRVAACNDSGVWNEEGAFLDFSIAPAFYQTAWFRLSSGAVALLLLWAGYRVRIHQVRRHERKLRDVVETIPAMNWTALPDGAVDFVNRHYQEYTALSAEEAVGSGWKTAVHPEDLERHMEKWRVALETGQPFENEVRYRRAADGQYRWFLTRAVPLRDAQGKILKWYGIATDIEERKEAEEERERLRQLESDLAHITRVSVLGELTASLAHEINQPTAATITNADACLRWLTRDQPDLERACRTVKRIKADGERTAKIVARLKSLYKKDAPTQRQLIDVNGVVSEMLLLLRSEANRRSVVMRTELAVGLPSALADRVQLQQVLMNLMLNGIEAMKETGGELTITSREEDGQVLVSVSDTGVGLPVDKMDQIFNSFVTTKPGGTGMGLSISRTIIESHGGRLWATNNERGATFHFILPG